MLTLIIDILTIVVMMISLIVSQDHYRDTMDYLDAMKQLTDSRAYVSIKSRFVFVPKYCIDTEKKEFLCTIWKIYGYEMGRGIYKECYKNYGKAFIKYKGVLNKGSDYDAQISA